MERELYKRSPVWTMANASNVPIDFNHGVHDGHTGSVPPEHTIWAFNTIVENTGGSCVSEIEIRELWENAELRNPHPEDIESDELYGRAIQLRRYAGKSRLTIFDGSHESIVKPAFHWLACHSRKGIVADECLSNSVADIAAIVTKVSG